MSIDFNRSLEQIEENYWGDVTDESYLITTCHSLRHKPLKEFTIEDLRIMIGQNISLDILIPIAFERLKQNIMAEGDLYPGDLLTNVLISERSYWIKNPDIRKQLSKLYGANLSSIEKRVGRSITKTIFRNIAEAYECWTAIEKINIILQDVKRPKEN